MALLVVSGSTGCVGSAVVRALHNKHDIIGLDRGRPHSLCSGSVRGDLSDPASYGSALPSGIDSVIHCAAKVHDPSVSTEQSYTENVAATIALLDFAREAGARRFAFMSTIGVLDPELQSLSRPHARGRAYALSKLQAEEKLQSRAKTIQMDVLCLRLATVYGAGDRGNLGRMAIALAAGRYVGIDSGKQRKLLVSAERIGREVGTWLQQVSGACDVVRILHDDAAASMHTIENAMAEALCVAKPRRVPRFIGEMAAAAGTLLDFAGIRLPLDRQILTTYLSDVPNRYGLSVRTDNGPYGDALRSAFQQAYVRPV